MSDEGSAVYFLQSGQWVKIGFSYDLKQRIITLRSVNPGAKLVGYIDADWPMEKALHERFAEYRGRGEWFRYEGALLEFIQTETRSLPVAHCRSRNKALSAKCELEQGHAERHTATLESGEKVQWSAVSGRPSITPTERRVGAGANVLPETLIALDALRKKFKAGSRGVVIDVLVAFGAKINARDFEEMRITLRKKKKSAK